VPGAFQGGTDGFAGAKWSHGSCDEVTAASSLSTEKSRGGFSRAFQAARARSHCRDLLPSTS
jgi:hypothetical protein